MADANGAIQSITIPRVENRTLPTPHIVYAILITLPVRSWTVYRRYSEFAALHQTFIASAERFDAPHPPAPLPSKHAARRTLKAITGLGGLMPQGDGSRQADEAMVQERRQGLELYLRAVLSSPNAAWRESDEFRAFIELPVGQSTTTMLGSGGPKQANTRSTYVPGTYTAAASRQHSSGEQKMPGGLTTRTLGGAGAAKGPIRESDVTRTLDDQGLMTSQQAQMDAQDRQLDGLAAILRRQKAMGLAINQELSEQDELLNDLDSHVDKTQLKMRTAEKQMDKLK